MEKLMNERLKALCDHFPYNPLVMRDGSIHKISWADLQHAEDQWWNVKLILRPLPEIIIPGSLDEVVGFFECLKQQNIDYSGLIEKGLAISTEDLEKDPYVES